MDPSSFVREVTAFLQQSTRSAEEALRLIEIVYHIALLGEMPKPRSVASAPVTSDQSDGEASWAQLMRHAQMLLRSATTATISIGTASSNLSGPVACLASRITDAKNNPSMHGLQASFFWKSSFSLLSDTLLAGVARPFSNAVV